MSFKLSSACLFFVLAAVAGGCQTSSGPKMEADATRSVFIGGNGQQTIVIPEASGVKVYSTSDKPCAKCIEDAKEYFLTGKLEEKCPVCGGTRTVVNAR